MIEINYKDVILGRTDDKYIHKQSNYLSLTFLEDPRLKHLNLTEENISIRVRPEKIDAIRFIVIVNGVDKELEESIQKVFEV